MTIGNDAAFTCASANGISGLNYKCNQNANNQKFDFIFQGVPVRIRKIQFGGINGINQSTPTGNTLSQNSGVVSWYHMVGGTGNAPVYYYYYSPNSLHHLNTLSANVIPMPYTNTPFCDMLFPFPLSNMQVLENHAYNEITQSQLDTLRTAFYELDSNYGALNTLYIQLLDNGNTDSLVEEIQNATINDQLITRQKFIEISPYVTLSALRELAQQEIVSNPILLEILLLNPNATNDGEFINYLMYEKPNPLPLYMINLIRLSWSGSNPRRELFNSISSASYSKSILANHVLGVYMENNELKNTDSVFVWMQKNPSLKNSITNVDYLLNKGEISEAANLLASIPNTFAFTPEDSIEYAAYSNLYDFKVSILNAHMGINKLDSTKIRELKLLGDADEYTMARTMAQSALCFFYNICYPDTVRELPVTSSKMPPIAKEGALDKIVTVYPNPAKDYVTFYYNLVEGNEAVLLQVMDLTGKKVYTQKLNGKEGQHIWDTRTMSNGNYIYTLTNNLGEKYTGKLTIKK